MKKVSRAKAAAVGQMLGKVLAARAAGAGAGAGGAGPSPMPPAPMDASATPPTGMKKGGSVKKMAGGGMKKGGSVKKMASGGSFRSSANGIAARGKTKGTQVTMKKGGKC